MANNAAEVSIRYAEVNINEMRGQLESLQKLENALSKEINIEIKTNADDVTNKLKRITGQLDDLKQRGTVDINVNTSGISKQINDAIKGSSGGSSRGGTKEVKLNVNTKSALGALDNLDKTISEINSKIKEFDNTGGKGKTSGLDQIISNIKQIQDAWDSDKTKNSLNNNYRSYINQMAAFKAEVSRIKAEISSDKAIEKQDGIVSAEMIKNIKTAESELTKLSTSVNKLFSSGSTSADLDKISGDIEGSVEQLHKLKLEIEKDPSKANDKSYVDNFNATKKSIVDAQEALMKFNRERAQEVGKVKTDAYLKQLEDFTKRADKLGPSADKVRQQIQALQTQLNSGSAGSSTKISAELKDIKSQVEDLEKQNLGNIIKGAFGSIGNFAKGALINEIRSYVQQSIREVVKNVKEIDSSLTQLQIVTGADGNQLERFFNESADAATRLGASVTEVLDSVQVFSRLGYNLKDSLNLSEYATIMSKVADTSVDDATSGITAIIKGYDLEASDAERVADVLVEVGQKYAISASELMEAFKNGGAAMSATGNSFEESAALFAAANASIQNASKVGTALRTVSARITGSKTDLEELGENYEEVAEGISKYRNEIMSLTNVDGSGGVDIMADAAAGEYKNTYEIFVELSKIWSELSETTRSRVSEILGGTRQLSVISSIIGNISDAENAYTDAMNANGTAQRAQDIYLDSIEGRLNQLHSSWQVLSKDLLDSDLVKGIVSFGNIAVKAIDGIVSAIGPLATLELVNVIANFSKFKDAFEGLKSGIALSKNGVNLFSAIGIGAEEAAASLGVLQTTLLGIGAALAVVYAAYKISDAYYNYDEKRDEYTSSKNNYDQTKSELSSLEAKLKETSERISELNSIEHLTLVEEAELNRLEQQNEELRTEYEIKKKIADLEQESTRQAAESAFNARVSTEHEQSEFLRGFGKASGIALDANYDNIIEQANAYIDAIDAIDKKRNLLYEKMSNTSSERDRANIQKSINELGTLEGQYEGELSEILKDIYSYRSEFVDDNGNALEGYEDYVRLIDKVIDRMRTAEERAKQLQAALEGVFDVSGGDKKRKDLIDSIGDMADYKELIEYFDEHKIDMPVSVEGKGVKRTTIFDYWKGVADGSIEVEESLTAAEYSATKTADALDTVSKAYKTLGTAMSEMASGSLSSGTINDIIGQLTKTDGDNLSYLARTGKSLSSFFRIENNGLVLNTKAYKEYAAAEAQANLDALYAKRDSIQEELDNSGFTGKRSVELNQVLRDIQIYEQAMAEAKSMSADFFSAFDASTSMYSTFDEINKKIETGGMSMQEALSYAEKYPEISEYIMGMVNGYEDMNTVLDSILAKNITDQVTEIDKKLADPDITEREIANLEAIRQGYVDLAEAVMLYGREAAVVNKGIIADNTSYLNVARKRNEYQNDLNRAMSLGWDGYQSVFGNIDMNNRQVLKLDTGEIATVLGSSATYDGLDIAFSPLLQTENGPVKLSQSTIDKYISGLMDKAREASEDGSWTSDDLFKLDAEGMDVDGTHIKNILADIGETAKATGELMHFIGKDGQLAQDVKEIDSVTKSVNNYKKSIKAENTKKQIKNLWDSDVFSSARDDLVKLAEQSGITSDDILDLAEDNEYLSFLMDETGISATYLAEIFERLSLNGAGALDEITADTIALDSVINELAPHIQASQDALNNFGKANTWDYDDQFNEYQSIAASLMQNIENGTFGAEFYRQMKLLTGKASDDWGDIQQLYNTLPSMFGLESSETQSGVNKGDIKWSADDSNNGLGFLEKLADNWDAVKQAASDAGYTLDEANTYVKELGDSYDFKYNADDIQFFAKALGMTEEATWAAIRAWSMYGAQVDTFDYNKLIRTLDDSNLEFDGLISEGALRNQLELLGQEPWMIDLIVEKLYEMQAAGDIEGFTIFDESDVENAQLLADKLQSVKDAGDGLIDITDFVNELRTELGLTDKEIANVLNSLDGIGKYRFSMDGVEIGAGQYAEGMLSTTNDLIKNAREAEAVLSSIAGKNISFDYSGQDPDELAKSIERVKSALNSGDLSTDSYDALLTVLQALEAAYARFESHQSLGEILASGADGTNQLVSLANQYVDAMREGSSQVDILRAKIQEFSDEQITATFNVEGKEELFAGLDDLATTEIKPTVDTGELLTSINESISSIKDDGLELKFTGDSSDAESTMSAISSKIKTLVGKPYSFVVKAVDASTVVLNTIISKLAQIQSKTITVNTNYTSSGTKGTDYWTKYYGSASGTANAGGNWGTKQRVRSLVGELGPEILVDPASGTWQTIGDNGAEFVDVPKGGIIFNHLQAEALLKYGRINGRGKAFASGTAFAIGGNIKKKNPVTGATYSSSYTSNSSSVKSSSKSSGGSSSSSAEETAENLDWIEILLDRIERKVSELDKLASSAFKSFGDRAKYTAEEIAEVNKEINAQSDAYYAYLDAANLSALPESYKQLVREGTLKIEAITDKDLKEQISEYKELYEKAIDCRDAVTDLREDLSQLYQDMFDMAVERFDKILNTFDAGQSAIEEYIAQAEALGARATKTYYQNLVTNEYDKMVKLEAKRVELNEKLNESLRSGAIQMYSSAWYDMKEEIDGVAAAIAECITKTIEWNNTIRELRWEQFDNTLERIEDINDEASFFIDLMEDSDMFDEKGVYTQEGFATAALNIQKYNTYLDKAAKYSEELKLIDAEIAKDPMNEKLLERRRALIEAQRDAVLAAKSEKNAIVDLVKEGIEKELEYLDKLIDKYKDALDSKKDMYDYQNDIDEKSSKIGDIQKQLYAYAGDDSEETRATIQKLKTDLVSAEKDLQEAQYNRYISDQKELLDDLRDEYELNLNKRLDDVDGLIAGLTTVVDQKTTDIKTTLDGVGAAVGIAVSENLNTIYNGEGSVTKQILGVVNNISDFVKKQYETSAGEAIIQQMKDNSILWHAMSPEEQAAAHEKNNVLAQNYMAATGERLTFNSASGKWMKSDNTPLYVVGVEESVGKLIGEMKKNSEAWTAASNDRRQYLANKNVEIANEIQRLTGEKIYRDGDGVWWIGKEKLYDKYRKYLNTYHTGLNEGIVGGNLKKNEELAVLLKDEVVLTNEQWHANVDKLTTGVSSKLSDAIDSMLNNGVFVDDSIKSMLSKVSGGAPSDTTQVVNGTFNITYSLPGVKNYEEFMNRMRSDRKFEDMLQSMTLGRVAGGSEKSKNKYIW